jgi:multidrug efflux pump subunit AcrA (membrane-fusion protein)
MDETDLSGLAVGNRTIYTFSSYPETTFKGEVAVIEPSLQTIDGSLVVVVWGTLPEKPSFDLYTGMTADVEIIAGEAKDALIIPIQALREITPESFAVFVVQDDGSLKLTPVTIGLRDFANAEVLTGLEAGDVISTGSVETE